MEIIDSDNPSNPTDATDPSSSIKSTKPIDHADSLEYTPESAPSDLDDLNDLDYADVEYPDIKQLRQELRASNTTIGCKLKEVRLSARFTKQELAIIWGVSAGRIERYENGEQGITGGVV